ncbi:MAG: hypothetical protein JKY15_05525 [Deltaproteobacteria bacterium]|nr:hypothetical protein [Deltaproteobacteria bacterium]
MSLVLNLLAGPIYSCGIALHAWISKEAIKKTSGSLKGFLEGRRDTVYNGSYFPDSGYAIDLCEATYGETAHWTPFMNTYLDYIKKTCRQSGGDILMTGECGDLIAYFFGSVSHALADVSFDSKFLVELTKRGYFPTVGDAQNVVDQGLDVLSVNDPVAGIFYDVPEYDAKPHMHHLVNILNSTPTGGSNLNVGVDIVQCSTELMSLARMLEPVWAHFKEPEYLLLVPPWAVQNRFTAPGGIDDSANYVVGFWEEFWTQLTEPSGYQPKKLSESGGWPTVTIQWVSL